MIQKYSVGSIIDTPKGKIKILSYEAGKRLSEGKRIHPRATIEFLATGSVINIQTTNISTGKFSDYSEKTAYGVGYLGSSVSIPSRKSGSVVRKTYDLWANMLKQAYGNYKGADDTLEAIAKLAKAQGVNHVIVEGNFEDGMFTKLIEPFFKKHHPCLIEEVKHSRQKEARIIDTLEPVMRQHRLVIDKQVIQWDYNSTKNLPPEKALGVKDVKKCSIYLFLFYLMVLSKNSN